MEVMIWRSKQIVAFKKVGSSTEYKHMGGIHQMCSVANLSTQGPCSESPKHLENSEHEQFGTKQSLRCWTFGRVCEHAEGRVDVGVAWVLKADSSLVSIKGPDNKKHIMRICDMLFKALKEVEEKSKVEGGQMNLGLHALPMSISRLRFATRSTGFVEPCPSSCMLIPTDAHDKCIPPSIVPSSPFDSPGG